MNEQESKSFVNKLYIAEIVVLTVSGIINVLALNSILQIKIAKLISSIILVVLVVISKKIREHENSKKTKSIYMLTVLISIIWFVTYILMWFYQ